MCGIAGIVHFSPGSFSVPQQLQHMLGAVQHRGPDGEGFVFVNENTIDICGAAATPPQVWGATLPYSPKKQVTETFSNVYNVGLGHRRLSIIDVSAAGHQPMSYSNGRFWIVYNGEVYNFLALKNELQQRGHRFLSETDTEVLLAAYAEWGENMLQRLDGMWAFAIFDRLENKLFAARDRFGVKPFYYHLTPHFFAFASEQKAFAATSFYQPVANAAAIFDYLVAGQTETEPEGFFKGIVELFPSQFLRLDVNTGCFSVKNYYKLPFNTDFEVFDSKKFNLYTEEIQPLVASAISSRLYADVPVGACLSGGIDSSAIVGSTAGFLKSGNQSHWHKNFKVFTSCVGTKNISEEKWAQLVVSQTGFEWHKAHPTAAEWLQDFEKIVYAQDIPFFGGSTFMHYQLMQLVKSQGIKVTVDGQGADEIFGGYQSHYNTWLLENINKGKWGPLAALHFQQQSNYANVQGFYKFVLKCCLSNSLPVHSLWSLYKGKVSPFHFLNENFLAANNERLAHFLKSTGPSTLNDALNQQMCGPGLKVLLRAGDRNSMAHSIEARTPFADHRALIEKVFSLPGNYKINGTTSKILLREATKQVLPSAIYRRNDKLGFASPEVQWLHSMKGDLKIYLSKELSAIADVEGLLKNYDVIFEKYPAHIPKLWRLINLGAWMKLFNIKDIAFTR